MKHKTSLLTRLLVPGLIAMVVMLFTGFTETPSDPTNIIKLSITGNGTFDLLISGETASHDPFNKREKCQRTPFELDIPNGQYAIVINRSSEDGEVRGKIQRFLDGQPKGSAASSQQLTLLQVYSDGGYGASGM